MTAAPAIDQRVALPDVVALHGDPSWATHVVADLARPDSAVGRVVMAARALMVAPVGDHVVFADRVLVAVLPRGADDAGIRAALREARTRSVMVRVAGARS